jgi:hypothetical protein
MRDKGLDPESDKATRTDFVRRVALALGDMHRKGKVEKIGRGRALGWRLAKDSPAFNGLVENRRREPAHMVLWSRKTAPALG